jgi:type I restriction enzyme S subunit
MSAITAKARRKMKKYAVLTREPRCFLGSFDFSWEQRKLGDIGKARSGVGFPDAEQGGVTGIPFFKVSDMNLDGNENEMTVANNYVTAEQIAVHRWSPITELPAIFFAKVGAAVMLNRKRLCRFPFLLDNNTMAYSLGSTKWDADFAKALFGTVDLTSLVQVGALPSYNAGDVESMEIYLPSLLEQEQLGGFFKQLDTLITLHQRKCVFLFGFFQAFISMIFTASTFSWEQRKFSDITFPAGEKNKDNLPLESYSITNEHGFVPQDEKFENGGTMREADKRMYYIVSPNSFAYNPARINVGSIGYQNIGKNVIVSSLYEVFKTSEDVDDRLLWHWFKSPDFQKLIMQLQEGGVRLYFYYDKLCMGEVSLPSLEEQRKIGKLFDTLDNLITLHQRKPFLMKWRTSDANRNQTNRLVL